VNGKRDRQDVCGIHLETRSGQRTWLQRLGGGLENRRQHLHGATQ
jgi:hypothetical protein